MPSLTPQKYLKIFKERFEETGRPEVAEGQMQYMRNQFEFYGMKAPVWVAISKEFFKEHGLLSGEDLRVFARLCYEEDHREMHYIALQMCEKAQKKEEADFIEFLEELITQNSWWDTVDWINKLVGVHFKKYPDQILPVTSRWMASDNFWLQRICLIFQLTYREQTDTDLLFKYILQLADSQEFFIQKAAGWALRQHSKTAPEKIADFIAQHPSLAPLTKREGLKWMKKQGLL